MIFMSSGVKCLVVEFENFQIYLTSILSICAFTMSFDDFVINFVEDVVEEASTAAEFPRRRISWREDPFLWTEQSFKKDFRLSKDLAIDLMHILEPVIRPTTQYDTKTKVLCALNFFAQGSYQTPVGENRNLNLSQSSVSRCISEVVEALNQPSIFNRWVHFPETFVEMNAIVRDFYNMYGFPGVIGCIDCTHVAIVPPPNTIVDEKSYVNRKHYHSINTQLICDANLKILNVNARFPGGTHDCHIWNNSNVLPLLKSLFRNGHSNYHLIGDSGYPLRPWCLTPIREALEDSPEARYSAALKKTRSTIERCNGVLKARFRCLIKDRVLHYMPNKASKIINACTVLHNMCIINNVEEPDFSDLDDEQLGIIRTSLPEYPAQRNVGRVNVYLAQGRAKQNQIVNSYYTN